MPSTLFRSQDLRSKYTRSDLEELADEEKQAWLEVVEERKEADATAEVAAAEAAIVAEAVAKGAAEVVQDIGVEEEAEDAAAGALSPKCEHLATVAPEGRAFWSSERVKVDVYIWVDSTDWWSIEVSFHTLLLH